jgi:hypothetical protein
LSFVGLDLDLLAHVVNVPLQKIRDLLDRGAERETIPKLGNVNRGPGPCMLSVHHGQPPVCLRALRALAELIETCLGYSHVSAIQTKLMDRNLQAFGRQPRKAKFIFHEPAITK